VKRYRVLIAAPAREHIRDISRWWRENRQDRAELFKEELNDAVTMLRAFPQAGPAHDSPQHPHVRRTLLRRTQHHVYYVIDDEVGAVTIVALWHTARGDPPPL
jgi:plasmid stabilization system protein ParE